MAWSSLASTAATVTTTAAAASSNTATAAASTAAAAPSENPVRNSTPAKSESKIGLDVELFLAGLEGSDFGGGGGGGGGGENGRNGELMAVLEGEDNESQKQGSTLN